jgi:hypothetical protein
MHKRQVILSSQFTCCSVLVNYLQRFSWLVIKSGLTIWISSFRVISKIHLQTVGAMPGAHAPSCWIQSWTANWAFLRKRAHLFLDPWALPGASSLINHPTGLENFRPILLGLLKKREQVLVWKSPYLITVTSYRFYHLNTFSFKV